ncbi:loganic acid O-methyltransferase-like [Magnolia sinica]|uniref:loganic acid O-methyltransferase-like n=1 Tax=Magnolia sinica TaxID=86752 RepID=UPI0026588676|nr:loganic acid O-methyltransferase-like [Magnolia sinica]
MQQQFEAVSMTGGHGTNSYANNSLLQRDGANLVKTMIEEAVAEKLEIDTFPSVGTFNITDLGCSVGPNTFLAVQTIVKALEHKCASLGLSSCMPEFQVFFSDHSSNDFNTLFASLPPNRPYFATGVPGSFYGRLFPKASLHFAYSSYALHWLSKVPKEVLDRNSPAWNKGRVICLGGPREVFEAFSRHFGRDVEAFLSARAQEMVSGGIMGLIILGRDDKVAEAKSPIGVIGGVLGSVLMDMAAKGTIEEAKVDSFNLPIFTPTAKEYQKLVESNGYFSIEKLELVRDDSDRSSDVAIDPKMLAMHGRAATEDMVRKHFGHEVVDEVYQRGEKKIMENSHLFKNANVLLPSLFVILKRKADPQIA